MTHTVRLDVDVPADRRVALTLPDDVPAGQAEIVVVVPHEGRRRTTGRDLLDSELFGVWRDRTDIEDPAAYAREQRERFWRRAE